MADIKFLVQVDTATGKAALKEFDGALRQAGDGAGKSGAAVKGMFGEIFAGVTVANLATKALGGVWREIKSIPAAAIEGEKAQRALESALETTGRTVPGLSKHFSDYATELQRQTRFDDEAVKGAQTLLLQLTRLDREGIDAATRGAAGLAAVMGTDLESAASLLAKALEGNFGILSRYGIKVSETGTLEEKKAELLDRLGTMYKRAQDETTTFAGRLDQLKNTYGDLKEAAGSFILKQTGVVDILNKAAAAVLDYINMDDMLRETTDRSADAQQQLMEKLSRANAEAGLGHSNWLRLTAAYKGNWIEMARAIRTGQESKELQEALTRVSAAFVTQREREIKAERDAERGTNKYNDELKESIKIKKTALPSARELKRVHDDLATTVGVTAYDAVSRINIATINWGFTIGRVTPTVAQQVAAMADKWTASLAKVQEAYNIMAASVTGILDQLTRNEEIRIENEYKRRRAIIDQTVTDEQTKADMIIALDSEFEAKRRELRLREFRRTKAMNIAEAIINTATAATAALKVPPPWVGVALATMVTLLGMAKVALIAGQPEPLAKGGILTRRMFSVDGAFEAGEAGPEAVIPISEKAKQNFNLALERRGGGGRPIALTIPIYVGGRKVDEQIIEIVNQGSIDGRVKMRRRSMAN